MESADQSFWKKCSTCKAPIAFGAKYYICSVSTCSGQRTGYVFCSLACFESHVPGARHRDAGGIQKIAPMTAEPSTDDRAPQRIVIRSSNPTISKPISSMAAPKDVLIIASRLKEYIQARADMNTSASVMDILSERVRALCDEAIEVARADGRKTVMDRDFK